MFGMEPESHVDIFYIKVFFDQFISSFHFIIKILFYELWNVGGCIRVPACVLNKNTNLFFFVL